jgi:hypothetical protein
MAGSFNAWDIEISEKAPLFSLNLSPLWVFVPWWLNDYKGKYTWHPFCP